MGILWGRHVGGGCLQLLGTAQELDFEEAIRKYWTAIPALGWEENHEFQASLGYTNSRLAWATWEDPFQKKAGTLAMYI